MGDEKAEIRRDNLCESPETVEEEKNADNSEDLPNVQQGYNTVKPLQDQFHAASKNWRKQMNILRSKLVNERNTKSLELGSQALSERMKELTLAQDALEEALQSTVEKMALFAKFEDISHETDIMLKEVNNVLCQLRRINDDCSSIASSKRNSRSIRSKSSRLTSVSSTSTARQRRLNLEEEFATLKCQDGYDPAEGEIS